MRKITEQFDTPITYECDVLVCGGGIAGIAAALAAARSGKKVILTERCFMLGGLATAGLIAIYTDVKGLFADAVWESLKRPDGNIYCIPTLKDNAYIPGRITNINMLEDLGYTLEDIQWNSYLDMEEDCMELIKRRNEKFPELKDYPLFDNSLESDVPYFYSLEQFTSNGLAVCNVPGLEVDKQYGADTVYNYYETDAFRELCLMRQRLTEANVFLYNNDKSIYEAGTVALNALFHSTWGTCWVPENKFSEDYDVTLEVFPTVFTDSSYYLAAANAIGVNSKDPERAMMVLECVNTDPYLATLLRFGVEGVHWQRNSEGKMELFNRNADKSKPGWIEWFGISAGNLTIAEAPESYSGPDNILFDKINEYNNQAIMATHMGFTVDTANIENELYACNNVINEFKHLSFGISESQDVVNKEVDDFIAKLKENGVDKIVEEVQRQLDAWLAN